MTNESSPELEHLLQAYFHQDMDLYGDTPEAVLETYLAETPDHDVADLVKELERLLAQDLTERELDRVVFDDLGSQFLPSACGFTMREWLTGLRRRALEYLQQRRPS